MNTPSIHWFRLDLRLADNPALHAAIESGGPVVPVFIWSTEEEAPWSPGGAEVVAAPITGCVGGQSARSRLAACYQARADARNLARAGEGNRRVSGVLESPLRTSCHGPRRESEGGARPGWTGRRELQRRAAARAVGDPNPTAQGEEFDPHGDYVRRWCPELAKLPPAWIHQPDKAPPDILCAADVELGRTYPQPVVSHAIAREVALEAFGGVKSGKY